MVFERVPIIRLNRCELMQFKQYCIPSGDNRSPPKSKKTKLNKSTRQPQSLIFEHEVMSQTIQQDRNSHEKEPQTLNITPQLSPKTDKKLSQQNTPLAFNHTLTSQNVNEPNNLNTLDFDKEVAKQTSSDSKARQVDNGLNLQDFMFTNNVTSPNNELETLNFGEESIKQTSKLTEKNSGLNQQNLTFTDDIILSQQKQKTFNMNHNVDKERTEQIKQLLNIQQNSYPCKNIVHKLEDINRPQSAGENESWTLCCNDIEEGQSQRNLSGRVNSIGIIRRDNKIDTLNDPYQSEQENLDFSKTINENKAPRIVLTPPYFNQIEEQENKGKGLPKDRISYQNTSMVDKIEPEKEIRLMSASCDLLNKMNTVKSYNEIDDLEAPLDNDGTDDADVESLRNNSSNLIVDHGYNTSSSKENLSDIDETETLFVESTRCGKNDNLSDLADTVVLYGDEIRTPESKQIISSNKSDIDVTDGRSDGENLRKTELVNFEIESESNYRPLLPTENLGDVNNDPLSEIEEEIESSDDEEKQETRFPSYHSSTEIQNRRSSSPAVLTKSRHTRWTYLSEIKEVTSDEESEFCCPKDALSYRRSSLPTILDSKKTVNQNTDILIDISHKSTLLKSNKANSSFTICSNKESLSNIKEETPGSVSFVSPSNRRRRTSPLATPRRSSIPSTCTAREYGGSMDRHQIRNYIQQTSNDIARLCNRSDSEEDSFDSEYIKNELTLKPKKSEYEPSHTRRKISRVNSLSLSPFNLRKNKNTIQEKPRATLTSDLTICGRNPTLEPDNYANIEPVKLRSWSVDSFVKNDFKFKIERRKVISFEGLQPKTSKETISPPCEPSQQSNKLDILSVGSSSRENDFDEHCTVNLSNQTMISNGNVKSISGEVAERQDVIKTCDIREESIQCKNSPELNNNLNIVDQKEISPKRYQNHTELAQRFLHLTETSPGGSELRTQNRSRRMSSDTVTHQRRQMENQFQPSSVLAEKLLESYRALDKHSYMYLGIASAKKCRAKRRRHSMDHIGSYRRRFRMLEELSDQGMFLL